MLDICVSELDIVELTESELPLLVIIVVEAVETMTLGKPLTLVVVKIAVLVML